jgi:aspartate/methionine/tyrosine aminotransferase
VLSDEIYSRIVYDELGAAAIYSTPGLVEGTIIMDGFFKRYAMMGWRLGNGIMLKVLAEKLVCC